MGSRRLEVAERCAGHGRRQATELRVGAQVLGTVMNKMKAAGGTYYYYNYGYGYAPHPNGKPAVETTTPAEKEIPAAGGKG